MPAMRRTFLAAAAAVVVIASAQQASAVCCDDTAMYVKQGYHANQMWPWPYVCPDRIAVREPFCIMINNGWRRENLIGCTPFYPRNQSTKRRRPIARAVDHDPSAARPPQHFCRTLVGSERQQPADRRRSRVCDPGRPRRPHRRKSRKRTWYPKAARLRSLTLPTRSSSKACRCPYCRPHNPRRQRQHNNRTSGFSLTNP